MLIKKLNISKLNALTICKFKSSLSDSWNEQKKQPRQQILIELLQTATENDLV